MIDGFFYEYSPENSGKKFFNSNFLIYSTVFTFEILAGCRKV